MKVFVSIILSTTLAVAQTRDAPAQREPAGTASISGVVVSDGPTPTSLRRAVVTVSGGPLLMPRSAVSDDSGRFTIDQLPAGRFTLKAMKAAFIATEFGSRRPGKPGSPIAIADGQTLTGVTLRMPRGAVVTGTISDPAGVPAAGLFVSVVPMPPAGPTHQFTSAAAAVVTTDDKGGYRAFGLLPGRYFVVASAPSSLSPRDMVSAAADADVDAALAELQRGPGAVVTGARPAAPNARPDLSSAPKLGFSGVFYPGSAVPAEAMTVTLAAGEERNGLDFRYMPTPVATISGSVTNPYGALPGLVITINPAGIRFDSGSSANLTASPRLLRNVERGEFMYINVPPGQYTIAVVSTTAVERTGPIGGGRAGQATAVAMSPTLIWAMTDVTVNGNDISGLSLNLRPAMRLSGRVVFDGKATAPPANAGGVSVSVTPTQSAGRTGNSAVGYVGLPPVPPALVRPDNTFETVGLLPGGYRLSSVAPAGWRLRSAMFEGRDVLDYGFEIGADRDLTGVVVTYTDQRTELAGTLQTPAGAPASDYFVVVFPADPNLWRWESRRVQSTRPASDGHYSVRDLPAGEYLVAALTDVESTDLQDPVFLRGLVSASAKVSLVEGEVRRQDLRLAR